MRGNIEWMYMVYNAYSYGPINRWNGCREDETDGKEEVHSQGHGPCFFMLILAYEKMSSEA